MPICTGPAIAPHRPCNRPGIALHPALLSCCILYAAYCILYTVYNRFASSLLSLCISTCTYLYIHICTCLHLVPLPMQLQAATIGGPYTPSCNAGPRRLKIHHSRFAKKITNFSPASSKQERRQMQVQVQSRNAERSAMQCKRMRSRSAGRCRNNECRAARGWACRLDNPAW